MDNEVRERVSKKKNRYPLFWCLGIKAKILFLCCFQAAKKRKNLLTNPWKGGIIVNVAENNTDTTKTIQKQ